MKTELIPLGTASAIPTESRHLPAVALQRKGRVLLFDCGEGTQRRFLNAGLNRSRVDAVFISHFHGDHLYGVFGLLTTMAHLQRSEPVTVVGPAGLEEVVRGVPGLQKDWLPYPLEFVEVADREGAHVVLDADDFTVTARQLDHRVFCLGYRFEEDVRPGRLDPHRAEALGADPERHFSELKAGRPVTAADGSTIHPEDVLGPEREGVTIAYAGDTRPCDASHKLAQNADLLYHEATFTDELEERAYETGHSTARQAATIAQDSGVDKLLIGHFSSRYGSAEPLVREARGVFANTEAAEELKRYELDPRDKWTESAG